MIENKIKTAKQKFGIVGNSTSLNHAIEVAIQVAPTDMSVLISGESGSGKESFSKIIHSMSKRKHGQFIAVNCGAIPEGTIDSELFGHEKGSFTGANESRKGYFEVTNNGTIFLDEIGEMPLSTQSRLLRIIENGEFIKVGSSKVLKTDVRIIAATNIKLKEAVKNKKFREDLYYRLAVFPVNIPPLRARKEDIPSLASHFIDKYQKDFDRKISFVSPEAMEVLTDYIWPGNVRQLENVIYHAMIMTESDCVDLQSLPDSIKSKIEIEPLQSTNHLNEHDSKTTIDTFDESIKQVLQKALDLTNGDIPETAKRLKLSRSSFYRMVQKYGLTKPASKFKAK